MNGDPSRKDLDSSDIAGLRKIGQQSGFPSRSRRKIWKILTDACSGPTPSDDHSKYVPHPEEKQVHLDTLRSFTSALPESLEESTIPALRADLERLIVTVLRRNDWLHYYQGYHDLAQAMLLVLGSSALPILEKLSMVYLRDYMLSSLLPSMSTLRLVHQIIQIADPEYAHLLQDVEPYYGISALLTWWTHSLNTHQEVCRVIDFLLSSEPCIIIYTIAAAALARKAEILKVQDETDMMFLYLSKGLDNLDLEEILQNSLILYESIQPRQLPYWRQISKHSCFKTFSKASATECQLSGTESQPSQWITDAKEHLLAQESEVRAQIEQNNAPRRNTWERPQKLSLIALGVGVFAIGLAWYAQQQSI